MVGEIVILWSYHVPTMQQSAGKDNARNNAQFLCQRKVSDDDIRHGVIIKAWIVDLNWRVEVEDRNR